jgi:1-acyl-sn-glycerol-3-phosphate acyltransferase
MLYAFLKGLMRFMVWTYLFGLFQVRGRENVPRSGPLLVCPNHISTIDPPLVAAVLPRADTWSMAKSEYFRKALNRWLFTSYHAFPVVRHSPDRGALRRAMKTLEEGRALIVYPEGTRVEDGVLHPPEPGVGFIAQRSGALVLPVALIGTDRCFPKGARWPRRTRVEVVIGKPFRLRERRPDGSRVSHQDASDAIMLAIAEVLPAEMRGVFSDLEGLRDRLDGVYQRELEDSRTL